MMSAKSGFDPILASHAIAIRDMLIHIGENPDREGLLDTPKRIIKSWSELYSGYGKDPGEYLGVTFKSESSELIVLRDIDLASMCEHHAMPFTGRCHIGYIPGQRIVGISKLARLVDMFAKRLQKQERLTTQIADSIMRYLDPLGCMVVVEAVHMCMRIRGVSKQNSTMVTNAVRGIFKENTPVRSEFLAAIK